MTTEMLGTSIDPEARDDETGAPLPVTKLGMERDGFRGRSLVINIGVGTEENRRVDTRLDPQFCQEEGVMPRLGIQV